MSTVVANAVARNELLILPTQAVPDEQVWRNGRTTPSTTQEPNILASRWYSARTDATEGTQEIAGKYYTVGIAMRNTQVAFCLNGRSLFDGRAISGTVQISGPGDRARAVFPESFDVLHLEIPHEMLVGCLKEAQDIADPESVHLNDPCFIQDPILERLGHNLLATEDAGGPFAKLYVDGLSLAILTRLLTQYSNRSSRSRSGGVSPLPVWRLRKAIDYMEEHIAEPVTLQGIADAVGLTRMHFAAQFRMRTGSAPHEYLLRRRIERAQELLQNPKFELAQIALAVGFRTQSHFTTVFKRFAGLPPRKWRQKQSQS